MGSDFDFAAGAPNGAYAQLLPGPDAAELVLALRSTRWKAQTRFLAARREGVGVNEVVQAFGESWFVRTREFADLARVGLCLVGLSACAPNNRTPDGDDQS